MPTIRVNRRIDNPRQAVWAVLADFPNIADWNRGVKRSVATSDATGGVGAKRHCDLAPMGALEETVMEWNEPSRMVVHIDSAAGIPIAHGTVTFALDEHDGATEVTAEYAYEPKYGILGRILAIVMLNGQLIKGFRAFLKDLDTASGGKAVGR